MSLPSDRTAEEKMTSNTNTNFISVANAEFTQYKTMRKHPIPGLAAEAADYSR